MSDTFILHNGKQFNGHIIDQTYEHYILKVEIAENVLVERKVLIKDVKEIIKEDQSSDAYDRIEATFKTRNLVDLSDYEKFKKLHFQAFYDKYPKSKHTDKVKSLEAKIDKEYNTLKNGGVKINKQLISKDKVDENRYEIMAMVEYSKITRYLKSKQFLSALRTFEAMERDFKQTRPYPMAAKEITESLPRFIKIVKDLKDSVEDETEKRERYIETLPAADRTRTSLLLEKKDAAYAQSLLKAREELKTDWLPLYKYDAEPIEEVLKHAESELRRLENLRQDGAKDGGKIYRDILAAIRSKDVELSNDLLKDFERVNPPESYLTTLKLKIHTIKSKLDKEAEQKKAAMEKAKAEAREAARKKAEAEKAKEEKNDKAKSSTEDKIKKKLNIKKKDDLLKEAEKGLK